MLEDSRAAERRSASRRRAVRRRRAVAAGALCVAGALVLWIVATRPAARSRGSTAGAGSLSRPAPERLPGHIAVARLPFTLPAALQDMAAVPLGSGRAALLGGLDASDTSTTTVSVLDSRGVTDGARLPEAQHDAEGVLLGGRAYVFGGGQVSSYEHILAYDPDYRHA